jgi:hypothetical protein
MRRPRSAIALVVVFCVAACAPQLVSDYDDQIDTGLSQLNTDVSAFVLKMNLVAGSEAGTYAANTDFYITEQARIDTLIVRAEAHQVLNSCPSTGVAAAVLGKLAAGSIVQKYVAAIPKDDCSVVLLQELKSAFADLQTFHQANGMLGIPTQADARILNGGLGVLIRAGITVEIAKKSGRNAGAANGS